MAKNTYGTGCFMLMNTGDQAGRSQNNLLTTVALAARRRDRRTRWKGSVFIGRAVVQWLRDGLGIIQQSGDVEALAPHGRRTPAASISCPPSPGWARRTGTRTPAARSSASPAAPPRRTSPAPRSRASPSRSRDLLEAMTDGLPASSSPSCASTAARRANDLLMQFQADLLGVPVVRPEVKETTALGAAYLAGLAVGYWETPTRSRRNGPSTGVSNPRWIGIASTS